MLLFRHIPNFRLSHPLHFDASPGLSGDALVYNSADVNVKPVVKVNYILDSVPTDVKLLLTWNGVTNASWSTFYMSGHSVSDTVVMGVRPDAAVSTTGRYNWTVTVKVEFSGGTSSQSTYSGTSNIGKRKGDAARFC